MQFTDFSFHPAIQSAIERSGYITPTPIQAKAIPLLLEGRDLLGLAQTGTGKTAAFVLPTLQKLQAGKGKKVRALILTPTRELAQQIHENIRLLAGKSRLKSCTIYGGVSKGGQLANLRKRPDVVVACPGRLLDLLNSREIDLGGLEVLILDEADQMFDQGFLPDIRRIIQRVPEKRQSMVFSATMPKEIRHLVEEILTDHQTVQMDFQKPAETISHVLFHVAANRKTALLKEILGDQDMTTTLVFTRTKYKAKNLARQLDRAGFRATALQGNMSQNQRRQAMEGFRRGRFNILVATDIAARGIDVSGISHVVNFDVPDTVEAYTHRTGRTGRARKNGEACSFVTADDRRLIKTVERTLGKKIDRRTIDGFDFGSDEEQTTAPRRGRKKYAGNGGSRRTPGSRPGRGRAGRPAGRRPRMDA